ncbi:MAG: hypothetical protein WAM39_14990 [Bryobacteraceae bacterium]
MISCCLYAQDAAPRLLLTPRRLHRLKLDRQRRTERWNNFEDRVKGVTNSPERGFELALYSVVAEDSGSCRTAVQWGLAHPSERRQTALIADWCRTQVSAADRTKLVAAPFVAHSAKPFENARDLLFTQIVQGQASRDSVKDQWAQLLPIIQRDPRACLSELYALFEFLDAADKNFRVDLRQDDARLFFELPLVFMLSLPPGELDHPDWKQRAGGLMMVNLDPNLQSSSFVQGWALEDPKRVEDGPGVAYEFLWANPYLPGLGYYNMDLWVYDQPSGLLLARKSWDSDSCWVSIFRGKTSTLQCPPNILDKSSTFGKLTLVPMTQSCIELRSQPAETAILSHLTPGSELEWQSTEEKLSTRADASGLALVSSSVSGAVCRIDENHRNNKKDPAN